MLRRTMRLGANRYLLDHPPRRATPLQVVPGKRIRVSIVIPVFNESATVSELLRRVWEHPLPNFEKELIIVESMSTDGCRELVQQFAEETKVDYPGQVKLVLQDRPRGKGNAVRQGLESATGDIVLIQDADLEYDVEDYTLLLEPIARGHVDFVLGSRHISAGNWKIREFEDDRRRALAMNLGGVLFHTFFNVVFHQELTDPTTMFKVFRRSCIEGLRFECDRFDFDFELVGKLIRAGYVPLEVPVSYRSRGFEDGKKINVLRDPLTWVKAIVRSRFAPLYLDRPEK